MASPSVDQVKADQLSVECADGSVAPRAALVSRHWPRLGELLKFFQEVFVRHLSQLYSPALGASTTLLGLTGTKVIFIPKMELRVSETRRKPLKHGGWRGSGGRLAPYGDALSPVVFRAFWICLDQDVATVSSTASCRHTAGYLPGVPLARTRLTHARVQTRQ